MEIRIQVTLTVSEGKRVIARAIASLPEVRKALEQGKILLKGGTTVSAVAEELAGRPLKISGRISPRGTRGTLNKTLQGHCLLLMDGKSEIADHNLKEVVETLKLGDVVVIGANAIDLDGNAAMCIGAPLGGVPGEALGGMMGYGAKVLIAAGLEKLIPGRISAAIRAAGRNAMTQSQGMAVGMVPLIGQVFTETDALEALAEVACTVIAKGGIDGAEGSTTLVVVGEGSEVSKVVTLINELRNSQVSGIPESLEECQPGTASCGNHKSCIYKSGKKLEH
ncbi:hypothetical protein JCM17380_19670 [Desulfosporosinus burensis]